LKAVRLLDCVLRFTGTHVDERKAAGSPGLTVVNQFDGFDFAVPFENRTYFIFGSGEWQVAHVDRRHSAISLQMRDAGIPAGTRFSTRSHPALTFMRRGLYLRRLTNQIDSEG
jgi:hypothetical protein